MSSLSTGQKTVNGDDLEDFSVIINDLNFLDIESNLASNIVDILKRHSSQADKNHLQNGLHSRP